LVIIGAGPAGMSAAITASSRDVSVLVLDEKSAPGGQIYRNVQQPVMASPERLGEEYLQGKALADAFQNSPAQCLYNTKVWHLGDTGEILFSIDQTSQRIYAREVLVTVGAMERPFPIPGWHLPGVMSAGSAQAMLKSDAMVAEDGIFVGSGPLLYLIVNQYLRFGVPIKAVIDTTPASNYAAASKHLGHALSDIATLKTGMQLLRQIKHAKVPTYRFAKDLKIQANTDDVAANLISFTTAGTHGDTTHSLTSEHIFLHQGVIPNLNLTRAAGLEHAWNQAQLSWQPVHDKWGQSSIDNISVAGDASAIVGANGSQIMAKIAAWNLIYRLGKATIEDRDDATKIHFKQLHKLNQFRKFIDRLYQPTPALRIPQDPTTIVCRCEELSLQDLRQGFDEGAIGPQELKAATRCGMGPCQGRQCGHTVSEILANWRQTSVNEVGYYRLRSPTRPLTLLELSQFQQPAILDTKGHE